jgi:hypothetical protein
MHIGSTAIFGGSWTEQNLLGPTEVGLPWTHPISTTLDPYEWKHLGAIQVALLSYKTINGHLRMCYLIIVNNII